MTEILDSLFQTIKDRQATPKPGSYTNQLFDAGLDEITKKVGEEAIEVIIAAQHQGNERLMPGAPVILPGAKPAGAP